MRHLSLDSTSRPASSPVPCFSISIYTYLRRPRANIAGVGFFTDAYDLFSISIAATMIGYVYHDGGSNTTNQDLGLKVAAPIGTLFGQLLFGWLADHVGRKRMYGIELVSDWRLPVPSRAQCAD
jgi:MFS family permease